MPFIHQYQFIEARNKKEFLEKINEEALEGWIPIWQNMTGSGHRNEHDCYMYRKVRVKEDDLELLKEKKIRKE